MALFGFGKKKEGTTSCDCAGTCETNVSESKEVGCCCEGDSNVESEHVSEALDREDSVKEDSVKEDSVKEDSVKEEKLDVKVLGSGCAKCNQLEAATKEALEKLGMDTTIDHVTDFTKIATYGVMTTPALVVDGKVVSYGKVLKTDEVIKILEKVRG